MSALRNFCGKPWQVASLTIEIDNISYTYDFKLDKDGTLVLLNIKELELPGGRAKVPISNRWVRTEMAGNIDLMNRFDEICTRLEKLYDVEVILASESESRERIDSDLLWEWE